jgi:predicted outer membrane repeat protein
VLGNNKGKKMNSSQMICAVGAATISIPLMVNAGTLLVDHAGASGSYTTISAAIADAATGDTIEIKPGVYTETLHVARDLTLECSDPSMRVVVNAGGVDRALNNNSSSSYANIDFTNGYSAWFGGGCATSGSPVFSNCRFYDNNVGWSGAGIYISEDPQFLSCEFYDNKSTSFGGGCAVGGWATPHFSDCSFHDNESEEGGGVSINYQTQANFYNCTFRNNEALKSGGAAANIGYCSGADSKFTDCLFEDNSAGDAGGALYACYGDMEVIGSDLHGNTAQYGGGLAVYRDANATVVASSIRGNNARHGGGVCLNVDAAFSGGLAEFSSVVLQGNTATFGGSIFAFRAKAHMKNCLLADAHASNQGGHVYADASRFDVQLCSFESGHAVNRGGMLLLLGNSSYTGEDNSYLDGQSVCGAMIWAEDADMGSVRGTFNDITSEIDAQQGPRIERGRAVYTDDCTIKFDNAVFSGFKLNDYFGISLFEHRDSYMVYEECVLENCSMKSPMRFPGSTAPRTTIMNADGSHVEMTNCTVENNKTGKHGNIIESTAGTMTVENSEFKKNGQISMGRISRGSIGKLSKWSTALQRWHSRNQE